MALPTPTPKFHRPPVTETVLGVQFAPLWSLGIGDMGLFWGEVRSDYPTHEVKPPLAALVEDFERSSPPSVPQIEFLQQPEVRLWLIDVSRTGLIQLQRDRFLCNWRKITGSESYPSYDDHLRPRFEREWRRFLDFLEREEISRPEVNQCEVTYINHLPVGQTLESFGDAHRAVAVLSEPSRRFLPPPEMIRFGYQYVLPDKKGRLYVEGQPALSGQDGRPIFQLSLTARGRPSSGNVDAVMAWLDLGHEWVVHGFADFTTIEMHRLWERYR